MRRFGSIRHVRMAAALVGWLGSGLSVWGDADNPDAAEMTSAPLDISVLRDLPQAYRFVEVMEAISGQPVMPWHDEAKVALRKAIELTLARVRAQPIQSGRVNEVGNQMELVWMEALRECHFTAEVPRTLEGTQRSAGYPDVAASFGGVDFYIEVKTFSEKTRKSSQRSFYLSLSEHPKVIRPAIHLLVGFEMEAIEPGSYIATDAELVDLYELPLNLKHEFNASNRDLYQREAAPDSP